MVSVERAVNAYILLREQEKQIKARHKEELAGINDKKSQLENWLHKQLIDQDVESMRTNAGTAYIAHNKDYSVEDWEAALEFIKDNDHWDMLTARVSKSGVEDFVETHGELPPGITQRQFDAVRVRRS